MKLHIVSDLHIESAAFVLPETDADVLVLAGDIGRGRGGLALLLEQTVGKPVVYVPLWRPGLTGCHVFSCPWQG